jgi:phosphoenolpyruvate phosphomutase
MNEKAAILRRTLAAERPTVLAGAHDALSARLVEIAGFDAVWASGFEISASRGVPDASLLTLTDMLDAARHMNEASALPVVADCDGGFGNAVNVIHMVRAYEHAGVAAMCIEDSVFPKRCSFYADTARQLITAEEHALKIRAACDARRDEQTVVIARTEAFIAGLGIDEALYRADAYATAGADAILVHSSRNTADEVFAFARRWTHAIPLVAVPTTYSATSVDQLWNAGYRVVIFANQGLRAAIRSITDTLQRLRETGLACSVDPSIASLNDVFTLVHLEELRAAEQRYLTRNAPLCP